MVTRQELLKQASEFTTYHDVFALGLANTKLIHLSSDSEKWSEAVYEVWLRFSDRIPELRKISFDTKPPLAPHSDEAYDVVMSLAMSGLLSLPNPTFRHIIFSRTSKKRIQSQKRTLSQRYQAFMEEIVQILEEKLAP